MSNKPEEIPSPELLAQCEELNKQWIGDSAVLEPYFSRNSDFGDEWKFRIRDRKTGILIVEHLMPDTAVGHTYRMLVCAAQDAHKRGMVEGKQLALACLFESMCSSIGMKVSTAKEFLLTSK